MEAYNEYLCIVYFDHSLLLMRCGGKQPNKPKCLFRFQATCSSHKGFELIVKKAWLGLRINIQKSRMNFSKGVSETRQAQLNRDMGIFVTNDIGNYIGFKMLMRGVTEEDFSHVLDKIQSTGIMEGMTP